MERSTATAVGATAGYDVTVAGTSVSAWIKVLREVDVENRPQGTTGLFTIGFPLGAPAVPASLQTVTAKY